VSLTIGDWQPPPARAVPSRCPPEHQQWVTPWVARSASSTSTAGAAPRLVRQTRPAWPRPLWR